MRSSDLLKEVANLCCQNRIIPFLGAGCSLPSLQYDWDSLMKQIAEEYNITENGNMQIAQRFINQYGKNTFCDILRDKLSISNFDDDKGYVYLAILSMAIGIIYTTNQDNIFEKCCKKYGFKYTTVITLDDLVAAKIGDGLYIKYHGDYNVPESVVFGEDDYLDRIDDKDNFIDVRLKSDMLGRKILFIGYSFRDVNLKLFFRRLKNVFGMIPESYMIVWNLDSDLENECNRYNIKIINPKELYPHYNVQDAYLRTIEQWCDIVFQQKTSLAIDEFFNYKYSRRVISRLELDALSRLLDKIPPNEYIKKFRTKMDSTMIPIDFEVDVTKIFIQLANSCTENEAGSLHGLMLNLQLTDDFNIFITMVYFYIAHNSIKFDCDSWIGYSSLGLVSHKEELLVLALTTAFEVMRKNNIPVSDFYRGGVTSSITDRSINVNGLPIEIRQYIINEFDIVWKQKHTTYENPIKRQYRLMSDKIKPKHDKKMVCDIYNKIHDKIANPYYFIMGL